MAYNPAMYQTYGNMYGANYAQYPQQVQQAYTPQQNTASAQAPQGIIWVDGEIGAKAYQLPAGWPMNTPLPLWDTNDTIIYLKSVNQLGMPNPLQKIHYKIDDTQTQRIEQSGATNLTDGSDMSEYVRKDDLEQMKAEITKSITDKLSQSGATSRRSAKGEE